ARGRLRGSFFFQAEDGIRDKLVTGVQTCALPICIPFRRGDTFLGGSGGGRERNERSKGESHCGIAYRINPALRPASPSSPLLGDERADIFLKNVKGKRAAPEHCVMKGAHVELRSQLL